MFNWSFCNLIGDNRFSVILHKSLMLGRPDPLRVLPRGCGYARLVVYYDHSLVVTDTNTPSKFQILILFELWVSNDRKKKKKRILHIIAP